MIDVEALAREAGGDPIKAAEQRGYKRGYAAGKRRVEHEISVESRHKRDQAMLDRIYLALLPVVMQVHGWKIGEEPVTTTDQRIHLAQLWARPAFKKRPAP